MKKIFSVLLCITVMMCSAAGCGQGKKPSDKSNESDSNSVTVDDSSTEASTDGFDWNEVKKDITLDGKKIDFPFSMNDLGEGYEMPNVSDDFFGENSCHGLVEKTDEYGASSWICTLYFDGLKSDEYNDDIKCTRITAADTLTVQGIGKGSSLEDAEKLFGTPYEKDDFIAFYLSKTGTERIEINYDSETNKVKAVEITLNFKEE